MWKFLQKHSIKFPHQESRRNFGILGIEKKSLIENFTFLSSVGSEKANPMGINNEACGI